jgi:DNA-binding IclR family transcriptional regulator
MRGPIAPTDRHLRDDIEAAIAAFTTPERAAVAAHLLTVMFAQSSECHRSVAAISAAAGLPRTTTDRWLTALIAAGFLSKKPAGRGVVSTYRLHLPLRRQP